MIARCVSTLILLLTLNGCLDGHPIPPKPPQDRPLHIGVFLPLSGSFSKEGQAVKHGITLAFYHPTTPQRPTLSFYDTNQASMEALYQRALKDGAHSFIGPLRKDKIKALSLVTEHRILFLNQTDRLHAPQQFVLTFSPEEEAVQLAEKARAMEKSHALVIYPDTAWGHEMFEALGTHWCDEKHDIVDQLAYRKALTKPIAKLLKVNESDDRHRQLDRQIHQTTQFIPISREDIDIIFLIAHATVARQIKPLLSFYFLQHQPVYSTSHLYEDRNQFGQNHDLEGIIFCDMPFMIAPNKETQTLKKDIQPLWQKSFLQHPRLYALGIDAYRLVAENKLDELSIPKTGYSAQTGWLHLDMQHIHRQLTWARMTNGKPKLLLSAV